MGNATVGKVKHQSNKYRVWLKKELNKHQEHSYRTEKKLEKMLSKNWIFKHDISLMAKLVAFSLANLRLWLFFYICFIVYIKCFFWAFSCGHIYCWINSNNLIKMELWTYFVTLLATSSNVLASIWLQYQQPSLLRIVIITFLIQTVGLKAILLAILGI